MAILSGPQIRDEVSWGTIEIDPYDVKRVQPNSIDLTLGKEVRTYSKFITLSSRRFLERSSFAISQHLHRMRVDDYLDTRTLNETQLFTMDDAGWVLKPGILYLMHTAERIHTKKFVTQLNGKSSLARLGVIVHFTAAYGETGFNGQYTLEVSAMHPVKLYPGMAICQAVFNTVYGQVEDYREKGHYVGDAAKGAEPSHSYEQFEDHRR